MTQQEKNLSEYDNFAGFSGFQVAQRVRTNG